MLLQIIVRNLGKSESEKDSIQKLGERRDQMLEIQEMTVTLKNLGTWQITS